MGPDQGIICTAPDQGHIPVAHQHIPVKALQGGHGTHDRVAGAQLLVLYHSGIGGECRRHHFFLIPHHQHGVLHREEIQLSQHIVEQGLPAGKAHDLGQVTAVGTHSGAFSGGQYDCFQII